MQRPNPSAPHSITTASHFSLLVIDDEPDLRTLYELTLLREGYDMDTAGSVQEALLHFKDRTYSAVITDMRLPDGSGLDVLRWLEESGRRERRSSSRLMVSPRTPWRRSRRGRTTT